MTVQKLLYLCCSPLRLTPSLMRKASGMLGNDFSEGSGGGDLRMPLSSPDPPSGDAVVVVAVEDVVAMVAAVDVAVVVFFASFRPDFRTASSLK